MRNIRFGFLAITSVILAVSFSSCGSKTLTEAQTTDAAKGVSSIKNLLSTSSMSGMLKNSQKSKLTAIALRQSENYAWVYKSGITLDDASCKELAATKTPIQDGGECSLSCAGSNTSFKMTCTIGNTITSTCKDKTYKFSNGSITLLIDMAGITQSSTANTGTMEITMGIGGTLEGSDIGSGTVACSFKSKFNADGTTTTSQQNLSCASSTDFSCSFDGKAIPCDALEQNQDSCAADVPAPSPTATPTTTPTATPTATPTTTPTPGAPTAIAGACTVASSGYCINYQGSFYNASDANTQSNCVTYMSGTFSAACSATNAVGTCTISSGDEFEMAYVYYSSVHTASSAQSFCSASGGVWKAN